MACVVADPPDSQRKKETRTLTFTFAAEDRISISFSMLQQEQISKVTDCQVYRRLHKMSKMMTCQVLMIDRDGNAIDGLRSPWGPWANAFQAVLNKLLLF